MSSPCLVCHTFTPEFQHCLRGAIPLGFEVIKFGRTGIIVVWIQLHCAFKPKFHSVVALALSQFHSHHLMWNSIIVRINSQARLRDSFATARSFEKVVHPSAVTVFA